MDRVYTPDEYELLIASFRKDGGFSVRTIETSDILNFKDWWSLYFKKTAQAVKPRRSNESQTQAGIEKFSISKYKEFEMKSQDPGYVVASGIIGGLVKHSFKLMKPNVTKDNLTLPNVQAYSGKVPIKEAKIIDVSKIVQYMYQVTSNNSTTRYLHGLQLPTTNKKMMTECYCYKPCIKIIKDLHVLFLHIFIVCFGG